MCPIGGNGLLTLELTLSIVCLVLVFACAWFQLHLLKQNGALMLRLDAIDSLLRQKGFYNQPPGAGLRPGSVLNDFSLPVLTGGSMTLSQWRGRSVVLLFMNPACHHCEELLPKLSAILNDTASGELPLLIISTGSLEENHRFFDRYQLSCPILLQEDSELAALYHANATPLAIAVGPNGTTLGNSRVGVDAVVELFQENPSGQSDSAPTNTDGDTNGYSPLSPRVLGSRIVRDGLKKGAVAPEFTLPTIDGAEISLSNCRGRKVLLVFSDPRCRPCAELAPKLEEWHRKSSDPQILMVSRGDVEANRNKAQECGLTFPIGLQRKWEISRSYGMFATPIGYLISEAGVLESDVAVGGGAILTLLSRQTKQEAAKAAVVS